jgi:hypothetical protein
VHTSAKARAASSRVTCSAGWVLPLSVGAWVVVAEGAVGPGAKTTLTAWGRHYQWAMGLRGLMAQVLRMPTRQDRPPGLRVVLVIADDGLRHVENGSKRPIMCDHGDGC